MKPEYDFSKGVRGKFYSHARAHNDDQLPVIVRIDPELARQFRTAKKVNDALRKLSSRLKPARATLSRPPGPASKSRTSRASR
jgi:hypothetical protein